MTRFKIVLLPPAAFAGIVAFAWVYLGWIAESCASTYAFAYKASSACGYQQPHNPALSADGKLLFVPEVRRHRILVLKADTLQFVRSEGLGDLRYPHDTSLGPDGLLYVADSGHDRLVAFDILPNALTPVKELSGGFDNPEGVLAHPNGRVYVTGQDSGSLVVFENDRVLRTVSGLNQPHGIGLADDGGIWVSLVGSPSMMHFDEDLNRTNRKITADLAEPRYMDLGPNGELLLTEKGSHSIVVLSKTGELAYRLGSGSSGFGENVFNGPEGVAISWPNVWIADTSNSRIVRYEISMTP